MRNYALFVLLMFGSPALAEDSFVPTTDRPSITQWENPYWKFDRAVTYAGTYAGANNITIETTSTSFFLAQTTINKPHAISEDYIHGICDFYKFMSATKSSSLSQSVILPYRDGSLTFKCS